MHNIMRLSKAIELYNTKSELYVHYGHLLLFNISSSIGAATVENSTGFPQKTKNRTTI